VERFAPDRVHTPGTVSRVVVALALAIVLAFAATAVVDAYGVVETPPYV
jgi:hypothetical protein